MKSTLIPAGICLIMLLGFSWIMDSALADVTSNGATTNDQVNSSGSNTAITGGYSSTATTNFQDGSSSNSTTTNTTNAYQGDSRVVNTANAPALSNMSQDVCTIGVGVGGSSFSFSASIGTYKRDLNCERLKLAKALHDMGMKVASISLLCQNPMVFEAMHHAGSYCPYDSKIGLEAKAEWEKYGKLRPDYEEYTKNLRIIEKVDNEILEDLNGEDQTINYSGGTVKLGNQ
jgi:hypothetical protein